MIIQFQAQVRTQTTLGQPSICSIGIPQKTEAEAWNMIRKQAMRLWPKRLDRREAFIQHGLVVPIMTGGKVERAKVAG